MRMLVFSVYDTKSECYMPPFYLTTVGQAVRAFVDCVNDPKHQFSRHPADYTLFELGYFDDALAKFELHASPHNLGVGVQFVSAPPAPLFEMTPKGVEAIEKGVK